LPNVGPYIYDVSISGFTRSSIYIYDISSLRVKMPSKELKPKTQPFVPLLHCHCLIRIQGRADK